MNQKLSAGDKSPNMPTHLDILAMARQAGWTEYSLRTPVEVQRLEAFATLVCAAERESCAKLCEDDGMLWGARYAAKIRARSANV